MVEEWHDTGYQGPLADQRRWPWCCPPAHGPTLPWHPMSTQNALIMPTNRKI